MHCDVAVIGAGPAGALAAHSLARRGADVALVDKAAYPRFKVCGCCLNDAGVRALTRAGLGSAVAALGGRSLTRMDLAAGGRRASVQLPGGLAVSRRALDRTLVLEAQRAGARLFERTTAEWSRALARGHRLRLRTRFAGAPAEECELDADVVLVADGVGGTFLRSVPGFVLRARATARMGVGAVLERDADDAPDDPAPGTVRMACGRSGYCGVVRIEGDRLAVAAAADAGFIRRCGGPGGAAEHLIAEAGLPPVPGLRQAAWGGTPGLTRRWTPVAARHMFLLGDAAGYVEPFTGEGMGWALASGEAVVPCALPARVRAPVASPRDWARVHRRLLRRRHRRCGVIARALRHPALVRAAVGVLAQRPDLAATLGAHIGGRARREPI